MRQKTIMVIIVLGILAGVGFVVYRNVRPSLGRSGRVLDWLRNPEAHPEWNARLGARCSPEAPFIFPTDGFIGYLYDDSFKVGHRHQGIDIFAGTEPGMTPVVAAYAGYLTRQADWKSSVIVRVPDDPLNPGVQIWIYYTHLADANGNSYIDPAFPPGTREVFIEAGTLLGYQGNYSGNPANPVGVHLHISIVRDDGMGNYLNELDIRNTLDPSPYLGLPLNASTNDGTPIICGGN